MKGVICFLFLLLMYLIISLLFHPIGYQKAMLEAYDRGYAVECLGVTGYHWECEEVE